MIVASGKNATTFISSVSHSGFASAQQFFSGAPCLFIRSSLPALVPRTPNIHWHVIRQPRPRGTATVSDDFFKQSHQVGDNPGVVALDIQLLPDVVLHVVKLDGRQSRFQRGVISGLSPPAGARTQLQFPIPLPDRKSAVAARMIYNSLVKRASVGA